MKPQKKQATIGSFFGQKSSNKENTLVNSKVNGNAIKTSSMPAIGTRKPSEHAMPTKLPTTSSATGPENANSSSSSNNTSNNTSNSHSLSYSSAANASSQASQGSQRPSMPKTSKPAWWVTPPKSSTTILPGARKRSSEPVPFPIQAKKQNSVSAWQGRVKPLARPNGMASRTGSTASNTLGSTLLTEEQKYVLHNVVDLGESVFFTGAAGTGKSFLLRQVVQGLKRSRAESELAITATTGLAAYHVGGQTLHRWAGIRTGEGPVSSHVQYIRNTPGVRENWRKCKVLVIDEVSMLDAQLLDKLEEIGRLIRGNQRPFGGIQVILTGDFFQLPPVSATKQPDGGGGLCFEAKCWPRVIGQCIVLSKIFRQKDNRLVQMLNAMRIGDLGPEMVQEFKSLARKVEYDDGLEPTELYPVRWQVDSANRSKMQALKGAVFTYNAQDSSTFDSSQKLLDQLICYKTLELKIGAQVLLIRNLTDQLINGRRGVVLTFMSDLEWAALGPLLLQNKRALEVYNAVINAAADHEVIRAEIEEIDFPDSDTKLRFQAALNSPLKAKLPIVDFRFGQVVPIERTDFTAMSGGRGQFSEVTRNQIPLVPSWALSIHKAQGQTLDRLVVDLGHVFEAGQAYVAVSRATSYDRLEIRGFSKDKVRVHPRVSDFYRTLQRNDNDNVSV